MKSANPTAGGMKVPTSMVLMLVSGTTLRRNMIVFDATLLFEPLRGGFEITRGLLLLIMLSYFLSKVLGQSPRIRFTLRGMVTLCAVCLGMVTLCAVCLGRSEYVLIPFIFRGGGGGRFNCFELESDVLIWKLEQGSRSMIGSFLYPLGWGWSSGRLWFSGRLLFLFFLRSWNAPDTVCPVGVTPVLRSNNFPGSLPFNAASS